MKSLAIVTLALLAATPALAQQGVTANEIVIGTAQDLSGPIVALSKPAVNGMRMRIDEINAEGGVNGRKLRLVVEDHGYDPKKAVLAAQKMVQQDKIFAALGSIGTPTAVAAMQIYLDAKVAHLFPLTGARQMFEPMHDLKYSFSAPYYDQIRAAMKRVIKDKNLKKVCTIYQDDDFGLEVMHGGEQALKDLGMTYAEKTTYKRGATDFASQVAKMKEAGCDGVVMGTIIRETIGMIATAGRKLDWNPAIRRHHGELFRHHPQARRRGGERFLFGLHHQLPLCGRSSPRRCARGSRATRASTARTRPCSRPTAISSPSCSSRRRRRPARTSIPTRSRRRWRDADGSGAISSAVTSRSSRPTRHLGSDRAMLCQIQDGKWKSVSEYLTN